MRVGKYAVVDGIEYRYVHYYDYSPFYLTWSGEPPAPPGFVERGGQGRWERRVMPEEISQLIEVRTTARHRGVPVIVSIVFESIGMAEIVYVLTDPAVQAELADVTDAHGRQMVPLDELSDVIEQTVQLPVPPPGSANARGPVRAGGYATYEGVVYHCGLPHRGMVRLWAGRFDPQPPGFERSRRGGEWTAYVPSEQVTGFFHVRTTARWKGHPVLVRTVRGDLAEITYVGDDIDGRPELSHQQHGEWEGWVEVATLTHVLEVPSDVRL